MIFVPFSTLRPLPKFTSAPFSVICPPLKGEGCARKLKSSVTLMVMVAFNLGFAKYVYVIVNVPVWLVSNNPFSLYGIVLSILYSTP